MINFSLVLPCYNESEHLRVSCSQILTTLKRLNCSFEIIFVEDCSSDDTREILSDVIKKLKHNKVKVIYHKKNMGRGRAVMDGIMSAKGEVVGFIDIDCEVSPEYISQFLNMVRNNYDVVSAHRKYGFSINGITRALASKCYSFLVIILLGSALTDTEAGYKFFNRRKIVPILKKIKNNGWFWDTEIMVRSQRSGLRITHIPVKFNRRIDKTSTVRLIPDSIEYLKNIILFKLQLLKEK